MTLELGELRLAHPAGWTLAPMAPRAARLAARFEHPRPDSAAATRYYVLRPPGMAAPVAVEIGILPRPHHGMLAVALELERQATASTGHEPAMAEVHDVRDIRGRAWLRRESRSLAPSAAEGSRARIQVSAPPAPIPQMVLEYATAHGATLYTVAIRGSVDAVRGLASALVPSLAIATDKAEAAQMPAIPPRASTSAADPAAAAVVMVIAADVNGDRLMAMAGGSGVVVSTSGAVLTSLHVLAAQPPAEHAPDGPVSEPGASPGAAPGASERQLHDLFVIGRVAAGKRMPELVCAGRPVHGTLAWNLDLAVIRCDRNLDGQPWRMDASWPALATGSPPPPQRSPVTSSQGKPRGVPAPQEPGPGAGIRVLGFPDHGGGAQASITGQVAGWSQEHGQQPYLEIHAAITPGLSGGAVVSRDGRLLGVVTAFRLRTEAHARAGTVVLAPIERIGLVRPIAQAMPLLARAAPDSAPRGR